MNPFILTEIDATTYSNAELNCSENKKKMYIGFRMHDVLFVHVIGFEKRLPISSINSLNSYCIVHKTK
jgi:hypothetical protein